MIVVVMGVTGSGKTTVGTLLAQRLGWHYADADDFHSPPNKDKMKHGVPLTDADRAPWIAALREQIVRSLNERRNAVLACSALKQAYREELRASPDVKFVYLKGSYEQIYQRLLERKGHFADQHILASQFADLEEPTDALVVDVAPPPEQIVDAICRQLPMPQG
jgi:gluconokinase